MEQPPCNAAQCKKAVKGAPASGSLPRTALRIACPRIAAGSLLALSRIRAFQGIVLNAASRITGGAGAGSIALRALRSTFRAEHARGMSLGRHGPETKNRRSENYQTNWRFRKSHSTSSL